jgi:hypothetical protein
MTDDNLKILVDVTRPATLNDGAGKQTDFATLEDAVVAWQRAASTYEDPRHGQGDWWPSIGLIGLIGSTTSRKTRATATRSLNENTAPRQLPHAARGA